jgi:hypothetical protein
MATFGWQSTADEVLVGQDLAGKRARDRYNSKCPILFLPPFATANGGGVDPGPDPGETEGRYDTVLSTICDFSET